MMFVPSSMNGILLSLLEDVENNQLDDSSWTVKLVEKAGVPLRNMFVPKFALKDGCIFNEKCAACENNGLTCRQKGIVYSASCVECFINTKDEGVRKECTYIGESSRTFRLRAKEHMDALKNLDPKSFQLFHWFEKHNDARQCPEFKFRAIGQYTDALTRQISEAILILDSGGLNRKCEFRINEVCRMESKPPSTEIDKERRLQTENKLLEEKNILTFIEKIKEDQGKDANSTQSTNPNYSYCYRKRVSREVAVELQGGSKRRKIMDHSTPKTWRQKEDCSPPQVPGITPIKPLNESPEVVPPSVFESSEEGSFQGDKGRTYMSNELRGSRISLLKAETEEEYDQSCSKEVAMLLKSSAVSGCIIGAGQAHPVDSLRDNYFSTKSMRERTKSLDSLLADMDINQLSDWSNDSFDKKHLQLDSKVMNSRLLLGAGAGEDILSQPATPGTPGAKKRLFSPEKKTPRGRPRKFSTAQMQSSSLRKNLVSIIPDEQGQIKHTAEREVVQVSDQKPAGGEIIF